MLKKIALALLWVVALMMFIAIVVGVAHRDTCKDPAAGCYPCKDLPGGKCGGQHKN